MDCSGAYIPGHGTPTAILFGRNRLPVDGVVRTVRRIQGEPATPQDPASGVVWSAILRQTDALDIQGDYITVEDTPRLGLATHPWNMGGGGAAELQVIVEKSSTTRLSQLSSSIGFYQDTHADEAFVQPTKFFARKGISNLARPQVRGDDIRDWGMTTDESILFPYDADLRQLASIPNTDELGWFWSLRTTLWNRTTFAGGTYRTNGRPWFDYHQFPINRARTPLSIPFAFVVTHNHFVFDLGGKVFNRSAPVIKLHTGSSVDDHVALLGCLNSSTACFWMKQIFYPKGGDHVGQEGARVSRTPWDDRYEFAGSGLLQFPIANNAPLDLASALNAAAARLTENLPASICAQATPTRAVLDSARATVEVTRSRMIALQEELDWRCYRLYNLHEAPPGSSHPPQL